MNESTRELLARRDREARDRRRRRNRIVLGVALVLCVAVNAVIFIERDRVIGWVQERFGTFEVIIDR